MARFMMFWFKVGSDRRGLLSNAIAKRSCDILKGRNVWHRAHLLTYLLTHLLTYLQEVTAGGECTQSHTHSRTHTDCELQLSKLWQTVTAATRPEVTLLNYCEVGWSGESKGSECVSVSEWVSEWVSDEWVRVSEWVSEWRNCLAVEKTKPTKKSHFFKRWIPADAATT
jgi:hypothetical protein